VSLQAGRGDGQFMATPLLTGTEADAVVVVDGSIWWSSNTPSYVSHRALRRGLLLMPAQDINFCTSINLTKLDVLDKFPKLKVIHPTSLPRSEIDMGRLLWQQVAVAYKDPGSDEEIPSFPADLGRLERAEVVYRELDGWNTPTTHAKSFDELPSQAQAYVKFIEDFVGVKIAWIGTGPKREDMIVRGA